MMRTWGRGGVCLYITALIATQSSALQNLEVKNTAQPGIFFESWKNISFTERHGEVIVKFNFNLRIYNLTDLIKKLGIIYEECPYTGQNLTNIRNTMVHFINEIEEIVARFEMINKQGPRKIASSLNCATELMGSNIEDVLIEKDATSILPNLVELNKKSFSNIRSLIYLGQNMKPYKEPGYLEQYYFFKETMQEQLSALAQWGSIIGNILVKASKNEISHSLLDIIDLDEMIYEVERRNNPYKVPIDTETLSIGKVSELSKIRYCLRNNRLFFKISIPLIKDVHKIYKVNSFPIPQFMQSGKASSAYITPASEYLVIKNDTYYKIRKEDLEKCYLNKIGFICLKQFIVSNKPNCEVNLFHNHKTDWESCDIKYLNNHQPQFIKFEACESWLYSIAQPVNLTLKCPNSTDKLIEIQGVGILEFSSNCTIKYKENHLSLNLQIPCSTDKLILPNITLNIKQLTKILNKTESRNVFIQQTQNEITYSFWEKIKECEELIAHRAKYFGLVSVMIILSGVTSIVLVIITGVCILLYIFKGYLEDTPREIELELALATNPNSTEPTNDQPRAGILRLK